MVKDPNKLPEGAKEDDFEELNIWTLYELLEMDQLDPVDRENILRAFKKKQSADEIEDDEGEGLVENMTENGYQFNENHEILYPTDEYKRYLRGEEGAVLPEEDKRHETLRARMYNLAYATVLQQARENAANRDPKYLRRVANNAINNTPRLQVDNATHIEQNDKKKAKKEQDRLRQWYGTPEGVSLYRRASEPLVAQFLGLKGTGHSFLENGGSAIRATEYDDYKNATDIIYTINTEGLFDKEQLDVPDSIVLSVDVTTAKSGKNQQGVDSKFHYIGFERPYEIQWTVDIDYCGDPDPVYTEKRAPHFIIGLSENTLHDIAAGIVMDKNNNVVEYDFDKAIDFMVASEMFEQVLMHESNMPKGANDEHVRKLQALEIIFREKLAHTLGFSSSYDERFVDAYFDMQDAMRERDEVYAVTIDKNISYMKKES